MDNKKELSTKDMSISDIEAAIAELDSAILRMNESIEAKEAPTKVSLKSFRGIRRKIALAALSITFAVVSLAVCTLAYFTSSTNSSGNTIVAAASKVTLYDAASPSLPGGEITINEFSPGQEINRSVYAKNEGAYPIYVRAKISSTITLDERYAEHQDEVDPSLISYNIDDENWTMRDGYYYYNSKVGHNQSTTNLLSTIRFSHEMGNIYKDSTVKVKIRLETVQASNNGETVFDAEGWASAGQGGTP